MHKISFFFFRKFGYFKQWFLYESDFQIHATETVKEIFKIDKIENDDICLLVTQIESDKPLF